MIPFFTIIIPTYNSSSTLDIALSSIVNQTYKNFEVLIIDGISTDSTLDIARRYQKEFPNLIITSKRDEGIYDAINKAIGKGMSKNPQWKLTQLTEGISDLAMNWWLSGKTMNDYFKKVL